jgi:hypothetical protein
MREEGKKTGISELGVSGRKGIIREVTPKNQGSGSQPLHISRSWLLPIPPTHTFLVVLYKAHISQAKQMTSA